LRKPINIAKAAFAAKESVSSRIAHNRGLKCIRQIDQLIRMQVKNQGLFLIFPGELMAP
jgi:hypothetical protein